MITRYDLAWWNGARIAIVRMDTPNQRFSSNATLAGYVVLPACSQSAAVYPRASVPPSPLDALLNRPKLDPARAVAYITGWDVVS